MFIIIDCYETAARCYRQIILWYCVKDNSDDMDIGRCSQWSLGREFHHNNVIAIASVWYTLIKHLYAYELVNTGWEMKVTVSSTG